ncbi:hypothetical protein I79_005499 [Cricetulus griseus]|uniref:Uncharacterized protein n=1 Tax=Cricetulus griseus TaxID=10029 RepID=G3H5B9_CRIGR|nr:hypothetical protein I79_005499 [Cricetulus griseus]
MESTQVKGGRKSRTSPQNVRPPKTQVSGVSGQVRGHPNHQADSRACCKLHEALL